MPEAIPERADDPKRDEHRRHHRRGFWPVAACGAAVPIGMSAAVMGATLSGAERDVLVTAWVAVSVVGTASVISSALVLGKLIPPPPPPPKREHDSAVPE